MEHTTLPTPKYGREAVLAMFAQAGITVTLACDKCGKREPQAGSRLCSECAAPTYHIRRPLKPVRGNQFYRDKSDRYMGTFCGADAGYYDVPHRAKAPEWTDDDGVTHAPCARCVELRDAGSRPAGREAARSAGAATCGALA